MNIKRTKVLGSDYVGLFTITNDKLCFVPEVIDRRAEKLIEETLDVKVVKTQLYDSSLLAVFAKMNNNTIYLPSFIKPKEIENIEKEIKVKIINTQKALGNLIAINDNFAILSKTLDKQETKQINLDSVQTNIGQTDAIGSNILLTNKSFVINLEENKKFQEEILK
jgi:translation initiation factor 6 (eIF-6)